MSGQPSAAQEPRFLQVSEGRRVSGQKGLCLASVGGGGSACGEDLL